MIAYEVVMDVFLCGIQQAPARTVRATAVEMFPRSPGRRCLKRGAFSAHSIEVLDPSVGLDGLPVLSLFWEDMRAAGCRVALKPPNKVRLGNRMLTWKMFLGILGDL